MSLLCWCPSRLANSVLVKKIPTPAGMLVTPSDEIVGDGVGYLQLMKLQKK